MDKLHAEAFRPAPCPAWAVQALPHPTMLIEIATMARDLAP
jgi:hypothetical protein